MVCLHRAKTKAKVRHEYVFQREQAHVVTDSYLESGINNGSIVVRFSTYTICQMSTEIDGCRQRTYSPISCRK